jgi:hypothetical protein
MEFAIFESDAFPLISNVLGELKMYKTLVSRSQIFLQLVAFSLFFTSQIVFAQKASVASLLPVTSSAASDVSRREPFAIGETLVYEGKWSKAIFRGIDVADLIFKVVKAPDSKANDTKLVLQGEAVSKGALMKIARFSFVQKIDSTVESDNFRILQTVRHDKQNDRIRNGEARFDYQRRKVVYREIDPNNPQSAPRLITSEIEPTVQDLLSAIYYLRRQSLAVDKTFEIPISDSGVVYSVPVKITAREQIKTVLGKVWALRAEPQIFGDRGIVQGEGKMIIWLTDDARHLPVRAQIFANIGKVEIKIKRAEGLKPLA